MTAIELRCDLSVGLKLRYDVPQMIGVIGKMMTAHIIPKLQPDEGCKAGGGCLERVHSIGSWVEAK